MSDTEEKKDKMQIYADKPITVKNALVGIVGINHYDEETKLEHLDIDSVLQDVAKSIALWADHFHFDTNVLANVTSKHDDPKTSIYDNDVYGLINETIFKLHENYKAEDDRIKYDALIIMLFAHGYDESLIVSDGHGISFDEIRSRFDSTKVDPLWANNSLRLFIIGTCRGSQDTVIVKTMGGVPRGWIKDKTVSRESNISTYYATTKELYIGDDNLFIDTIDDSFKNMDLEKCTLYDILTNVTKEIGTSSVSWYCPEFVSRNKFKIKFKPKDGIAKMFYQEKGGEKKKSTRPPRVFGAVSCTNNVTNGIRLPSLSKRRCVIGRDDNGTCVCECCIIL
eukprot:150125_1